DAIKYAEEALNVDLSIPDNKPPSFEATIPLSAIKYPHPLNVAIQNLPAEAESITLKAKRIQNSSSPSSDGRIMIMIEAILNVTGEGARVIRRSTSLYTKALFGYFPRELGSMSLIVAGDLHLDTSPTPPHSASRAGNVYLPYVSESAA